MQSTVRMRASTHTAALTLTHSRLRLRSGKKVMFDCGIHPGLSGENSLPFLTNEDLDDVDVALITHFHLDHCAALPFLLTHTTFKVRSARPAGAARGAADAAAARTAAA